MVKPLKKKKEIPARRETVTFRYNLSPNYAIYRIDGAHGGIGGQGDIIANLFAERHAVPDETTYKINKDGGLIDPPETKPVQGGALIREIPFGISITQRTARSIATWLTKRADELDKIMEKQKEGASDDELL